MLKDLVLGRMAGPKGVVFLQVGLGVKVAQVGVLGGKPGFHGAPHPGLGASAASPHTTAREPPRAVWLPLDPDVWLTANRGLAATRAPAMMKFLGRQPACQERGCQGKGVEVQLQARGVLKGEPLGPEREIISQYHLYPPPAASTFHRAGRLRTAAAEVCERRGQGGEQSQKYAQDSGVLAEKGLSEDIWREVESTV